MSTLLYSQNQSDSKDKSLKVYYNGFYNFDKSITTNDNNVTYTNEVSNYDFGGISFALEIDKNSLFSHEIELLPLLLKINEDITYVSADGFDTQISDGSKNTYLKSAVRYQINHSFLDDNIVTPYLGAAIQLFGDFNKSNPPMSTYYPFSILQAGFTISIVPGLQIDLGEKIAIDIDLPIDLVLLYNTWTYNQNPMIPVENQKKSEFETSFFPKRLNARLGLIYRI